MNFRHLRRLLIACDNVLHVGVALILILSAGMVLVGSVPGLFHDGNSGIIHSLNDLLLALIFLEILWPVLRFLNRAPFRLNPFLYVGIISSTRRILLIEAEHSVSSKYRSGAEALAINWQVPIELGFNVGVILVLAIALRLISEKGVGNDEET